jgi:hypothetical protein
MRTGLGDPGTDTKSNPQDGAAAGGFVSSRAARVRGRPPPLARDRGPTPTTTWRHEDPCFLLTLATPRVSLVQITGDENEIARASAARPRPAPAPAHQGHSRRVPSARRPGGTARSPGPTPPASRTRRGLSPPTTSLRSSSLTRQQPPPATTMPLASRPRDRSPHDASQQTPDCRREAPTQSLFSPTRPPAGSNKLCLHRVPSWAV